MKIRRVLVIMALAIFPFAAPACAPLIASGHAGAELRQIKRANPPLRLAVEETGKGEPVLFIHGLGTSSYTWRHIVPSLSATHRVITIDLKGFGSSDKPIDDKYSIFDQAEIVKAFIEQEDLRNLTIAGHSFGGGVTLALALKLADEKSKRVKRLILVDSIAYRQPLPFFFQLLKTPGIAEMGMRLVPPEVQTANALAHAFHEGKRVPADAVLHYAQPLHTPAGRHALTQTISKIMPDNIEDFTLRYRSIRLPALLIWCDRDTIVPLALGSRLYRDLPKAELHVIRNCGHLPQEEKPQETVDAIKEFLGR